MLNVSSAFHTNISAFPRQIQARATLAGNAITDLYEIVITEELDPLGNNAPPKEVQITMGGSTNEFSPYAMDLQSKQVITVSFSLALPSGTFESVPMGTFYLYNWHNDPDYLTTTLYARDLLDLMSGTEYTGLWSPNGISLNDLAVAVIQDFEHQSGMTISYNIDPALGSIITRGLIPLMSHHDALMYIAQAGTAVIWMDRNNTLQIKQTIGNHPLNTMPYTGELPLTMQESYPKIAIQNVFNYFTANLSSYGESQSTSQVFSGTFPITGTATVWCEYQSPTNGSSVTATITGGTFVSGVFYSNGANITVSEGNGSVSIVLNGKEITSTMSQSAINNSTKTQPPNKVDLTGNPLLTTSPMVTNVLNWAAAECQGIYLYESESWMDPSLECGDVIYWDSQYSMAQEQAKIVRQEFRWNGALSGTINGKGLGGTYTPIAPDSSGGSTTSGSGGDGNGNDDYVRCPGYGHTNGSANNYTVSTNPPLAALVDGVSIYLDINVSNTGASTLNWDHSGAMPIVDSSGNALTSGKLTANTIVGVRYNSSLSSFQLLVKGGGKSSPYVLLSTKITFSPVVILSEKFTLG